MAEPGPNLFVVGAMRAGTTSLYRYLAQHPDVFVSDVKEPHWFAFPDVPPCYRGPGDDQLNERIVWRRAEYRSLFADGATKKYRVDASAMYFHLPDALRTLRAHDDGTWRYVVVLRDPVERAGSAYAFNRMRGREPLGEFEAALDDEDRRCEAGWSPMFRYAGASHYAEALESFLCAFPDRVQVVLQDDLSRDTGSSVARLLDWLELAPLERADFGHHNRSGTARSRVAHQLLRHGPLKRRLKRLAPPAVARRFERLRETNLDAVDAISEGVRADLTERFAADLARTGDLIGVDLTSRWVVGQPSPERLSHDGSSR